MPELPEVETSRRGIEPHLVGATILHAVVRNGRLRWPVSEEIYRLSDQPVLSVQRRAKYLLLELPEGWIIIHLGMSGSLRILPEELPPEKHDHVLIKTDNGVLIYNDARRFGLLTYCKTEELGKCHLLQGIGPDPFSEDFNAGYLKAKAKSRKTPVKVLLLDQKVVAGIGNIYASEALYKAGILPMREAKSLSLKECEKLNSAVREVLNQAIKAGGSTLRDYRKPDGSMGYFSPLSGRIAPMAVSCAAPTRLFACFSAA